MRRVDFEAASQIEKRPSRGREVQVQLLPRPTQLPAPRSAAHRTPRHGSPALPRPPRRWLRDHCLFEFAGDLGSYRAGCGVIALSSLRPLDRMSLGGSLPFRVSGTRDRMSDQSGSWPLRARPGRVARGRTASGVRPEKAMIAPASARRSTSATSSGGGPRTGVGLPCALAVLFSCVCQSPVAGGWEAAGGGAKLVRGRRTPRIGPGRGRRTSSGIRFM
jgi:hypothetical protein